MSYFNLYTCCIPVKGASRSIICDLQRDKYQLIPNALYYILTKYLNLPIYVIKQKVDNKYDNEIDQYFNLLIKNEYGFLSETHKKLKKLNLKNVYEPKPITNSIIDFDENSDHDLQNIISQLSKLNCEAVELRYYCTKEISFITNILKAFYASTIRSVEIMIKYNSEFDIKRIIELRLKNSRLRKLTLYNATKNEILEHEEVYIIYSTEKILSENNCGVVNPWYFISKTETFVEAKKYNSCLNKKICIDRKGKIKNCPSMEKSFGNIKETSLIKCVNNPDFHSIWNITKDKIEVCADCEFRYICQDCRAYTQNHRNQFSKPLKCNYDPYTTTWK